jgi:hypothetical protein
MKKAFFNKNNSERNEKESQLFYLSPPPAQASALFSSGLNFYSTANEYHARVSMLKAIRFGSENELNLPRCCEWALPSEPQTMMIAGILVRLLSTWFNALEYFQMAFEDFPLALRRGIRS